MESKPNIHINLKFKNAHINPNFIQPPPQPSRILINPRFLQQHQQSEFDPSPRVSSSLQQQHGYLSRPTEVLQPPAPPPPSTAIIRNTRRTLIRAPAAAQKIPSTSSSFSHPPVAARPTTTFITSSTPQNLIKIGKNKLVTAAHLISEQAKANEIIRSKTESLIRTKNLKRSEKEQPKSIYKLDRRRPETTAGSKKKKIVRKYSIKRVEQPKTPEIRKKFNTSSTSSSNGFSPLSRSLNRTNRSHLSAIKTRSITLLNKSTAARRKSNVICPIFRRLGKCLAQKRGRCHKVHDKNYVMVCAKFLRGACQDENCLLSHDTSYRKMPVCKYFLKGLCHKQEECRYLHKKQSDDTSICAEFAKGYCVEGEKCKLLHDYPETAVKSKRLNNVMKKVVDEPRTEENSAAASTSSSVVHSRYFIDEEQPNESIIPLKKKIATLPGYIPL